MLSNGEINYREDTRGLASSARSDHVFPMDKANWVVKMEQVRGKPFYLKSCLRLYSVS